MNMTLIGAACLIAGALVWEQFSAQTFSVKAGAATPPVPGFYEGLQCLPNGWCADQGPNCTQHGLRGGHPMNPGTPWQVGDTGWCFDHGT